jgi:hypothetical protein
MGSKILSPFNVNPPWDAKIGRYCNKSSVTDCDLEQGSRLMANKHTGKLQSDEGYGSPEVVKFWCIVK